MIQLTSRHGRSVAVSSRARFAVLALAAIQVVVAGCHRAHYRSRADAEAYSLIREKANAPHWDLPRHWIEIDPRSRMFDPFDPDHPPMPPDDPTSHDLMHVIDHKKHYPHWHVNGETDKVENPDWVCQVPMDENGVVPLSSELALALAIVNSRDYQQQFETLYLSALDVSTERFTYDVQFFGGFGSDYRHNGGLGAPGIINQRLTPGGAPFLGQYLVRNATEGAEINRLTVNDDLTINRRFATAGQLLVGFANSFVWEFTGGDVNLASSLINFSMLQPLLRQAGRDRELERLTIVERQLLANVRQMERFRRAYYVEIMTGANAGSGASRRGGVFGAGLAGFTGLGAGFGTLATTGGGGGGGGFGGGGAGAAEVGGFMGLLQDLQSIRNQQVTIVGLRRNLRNLNESLRESLATIPDDAETIVRTRLQIAQARQSLLNAESTLLNLQAGYHATLDAYKITLGLPPQVCINVDDPMIDQFNLIDPNALAIQDQITTLRDQVGEINEKLLTAVETVEVDGQNKQVLRWTPEIAQLCADLKTSVDQIRMNVAATEANVARAREDIQRLKAAIPERKLDLLGLKQKYQGQENQFSEYGDLDPCQVSLIADIAPVVFDTERLEAVPVELDEEIGRVANNFNRYLDPLSEVSNYLNQLLDSTEEPDPVELYEELESNVIFAVPSMVADVSDDLLDLQLIQARARADTVDLVPVDLSWDVALELARQYRRDWMNARAALVDVWRLIEFNADNLEGSLDVFVTGDIGTERNNPLSFNGNTGTLRAGFRFDAPLTRLIERNTYREALITYQQSKRSYYAFVDGITQNLRATLRTMDRNRVNFEERRIAVLSAIDQVVLNDQITKLREERGQESGVTAARDVIDALASLQNAQDTFLQVWLNYEAQRLFLDLNLGTMNLDQDGYWIDPGPIGTDSGLPTPLGMCPPPMLIMEGGNDIRPLPDVDADPSTGELFAPEPSAELLDDLMLESAMHLRRVPPTVDSRETEQVHAASFETSGFDVPLPPRQLPKSR